MNDSDLVLEDSKDIKEFQIEDIKNKIIHGDAIDVLKKFPSESVDLIFMDPPYFLQLPKKQLRRWNVNTAVEGVEDEWDKFGSFEEYDNFVENILTELNRIMKPNATIWIISTYHSVFRIGKILQDLGYWILNSIHWVKSNAMPNWLGVRFTNATETMIWAVKEKGAKKYTFNKNLAKKFGIGKVGANVWVIPLCTGNERLKNKEGNKLHTTQKPVELLRRVISITSNEGDIVLDPLAGTGTTGVVAKALNRNFIMIEQQFNYIEGAQNRFSSDLRFKDKKSRMEEEFK